MDYFLVPLEGFDFYRRGQETTLIKSRGCSLGWLDKSALNFMYSCDAIDRSITHVNLLR